MNKIRLLSLLILVLPSLSNCRESTKISILERFRDADYWVRETMTNFPPIEILGRDSDDVVRDMKNFKKRIDPSNNEIQKLFDDAEDEEIVNFKHIIDRFSKIIDHLEKKLGHGLGYDAAANAITGEGGLNPPVAEKDYGLLKKSLLALIKLMKANKTTAENRKKFHEELDYTHYKIANKLVTIEQRMFDLLAKIIDQIKYENYKKKFDEVFEEIESKHRLKTQEEQNAFDEIIKELLGYQPNSIEFRSVKTAIFQKAITSGFSPPVVEKPIELFEVKHYPGPTSRDPWADDTPWKDLVEDFLRDKELVYKRQVYIHIERLSIVVAKTTLSKIQLIAALEEYTKIVGDHLKEPPVPGTMPFADWKNKEIKKLRNPTHILQQLFLGYKEYGFFKAVKEKYETGKEQFKEVLEKTNLSFDNFTEKTNEQFKRALAAFREAISKRGELNEKANKEIKETYEKLNDREEELRRHAKDAYGKIPKEWIERKKKLKKEWVEHFKKKKANWPEKRKEKKNYSDIMKRMQQKQPKEQIETTTQSVATQTEPKEEEDTRKKSLKAEIGTSVLEGEKKSQEAKRKIAELRALEEQLEKELKKRISLKRRQELERQLAQYYKQRKQKEDLYAKIIKELLELKEAIKQSSKELKGISRENRMLIKELEDLKKYL